MFKMKTKEIINKDAEKDLEEDDILDKCDEILKSLKEIKNELSAIREGEIKELKKELDHRNRFVEQLIMAMLEQKSKPSSALTEYLAKKNSENAHTKSAKEMNRGKPNLP